MQKNKLIQELRGVQLSMMVDMFIKLTDDSVVGIAVEILGRDYLSIDKNQLNKIIKSSKDGLEFIKRISELPVKNKTKINKKTHGKIKVNKRPKRNSTS